MFGKVYRYLIKLFVKCIDKFKLDKQLTCFNYLEEKSKTIKWNKQIDNLEYMVKNSNKYRIICCVKLCFFCY